ncbi:MAG: 50S ribosomal protein L3 N(5)-glutamine methyltransferase [Usitatibacter sp.]
MSRKRRIGDAVADAAERLDDAGVVFGHGTVESGQEALWLTAHVLGLSWDALDKALDDPMDAGDEARLRALVDRRIATRKPAAYLLNEAWLGRHKFYVDERVIVPRSLIFELLRVDPKTGDAPYFLQAGAETVLRSTAKPISTAFRESRVRPRFPGPPLAILDLCTGSGCLAILAALAFPKAKVDAVDLSTDALQVAKRNVADYGLMGRVELVHSEMFTGLAGRKYDLIISNPPYVKAAAMRKLPEEYRREPQMALASGEDGLDHTRVILAQARKHLTQGGRLVVEIGHNRKALERAYPTLPFEWPKTSAGRQLVFALPEEALP